MPADAPRKSRKTYWHLGHDRRVPSAYEIRTSRLLYYPAHGGFAVNTPLRSWYQRFQTDSLLGDADWEAFVDPRQTTYASYVLLQREQETFLTHLLALEPLGLPEGHPLEEGGDSWLATFSRALAPLRFLLNGLHMATSYVAQMAPGGRVVVAKLFQAADELRRLERVAYRTAQWQLRAPWFGGDARVQWEQGPAWRAWRACIEELLLCYDWSEAWVALDVVIRPAVEESCFAALADLAETGGHGTDARFLRSFLADGRWQRAATAALLRVCVSRRAMISGTAAGKRHPPEQVQEAVRAIVARWRLKADNAVTGWLSLFFPEVAGQLQPGIARRRQEAEDAMSIALISATDTVADSAMDNANPAKAGAPP